MKSKITLLIAGLAVMAIFPLKAFGATEELLSKNTSNVREIPGQQGLFSPKMFFLWTETFLGISPRFNSKGKGKQGKESPELIENGVGGCRRPGVGGCGGWL